jgi:uncharacterized membrane protein
MKRITSIDTVRGIVMLIMAIDHARDLMHTTALTASPLDLSITTFPLFFTRWITHLCAPTFVFLSGVSAYLAIARSDSPETSRQLLLKRGLWLVLLELTIVNFGVWFDIHFRTIMLQVIAAIGLGFILLYFFSRFSFKQNISVAVVLALICNVTAGFNFPDFPALNFTYHLLISPFLFQVTPNFALFVAYPVLPWFAIMLAGYACGQLFTHESERRAVLLLTISLSLVAAFVILRAVNIFGDPSKFVVQGSAPFSILSFVNVSKYPPSLLFTLLMLSISFFLLFVAERWKGRWQNILSVYGSVPMLYYLLHFYLLHLVAEGIFLFQGYRWSELQFGTFQFGRPAGPSGVGLKGVYLWWLLIVVMLYPVCKKYAAYKKAHPEKEWLKYL